MKELSVEEKAKHYDKAINAIKELKEKHPTAHVIKDWINENFPELAETEDERIRKELIDFLEYYRLNNVLDSKTILLLTDSVAWLEKQGTQNLANSVKTCKDEQKPVDKVESKFKIEEGKWYICTQTYVLRGKIVVIKGQTYQAEKDNVIKGEDGCRFIDRHDGKALDYFRSWTIQDAKDGDVLAAHECLVLFKEIDGLNIKCYCTYHNMGSNPSFYVNTLQNKTAFYPATKEQRDILFQKMHEAGYEWDAEKKELKKIESYSLRSIIKDEPSPAIKKVVDSLTAWSEEDEKNYNIILKIICASNKSEELVDKLYDWFKSLKERVQLQNGYNPYKEVVESIAEMCKHYDKASHSGLRDFYDNVKVKCKDAKEYESLFPLSTWKPSDEQMKALKEAVDEYFDIDGGALWHLYQELKKLREE